IDNQDMAVIAHTQKPLTCKVLGSNLRSPWAGPWEDYAPRYTRLQFFTQNRGGCHHRITRAAYTPPHAKRPATGWFRDEEESQMDRLHQNIEAEIPRLRR